VEAAALLELMEMLIPEVLAEAGMDTVLVTKDNPEQRIKDMRVPMVKVHRIMAVEVVVAQEPHQ